MKLQKNSILNFGDTSFRRKAYMVEYRELLYYLNELNVEKTEEWWKDTDVQASYYEMVLSKTDFIKSNNQTADQRGRTLTNSLVKTGFINSNRILSPAGEAWLNDNLAARDEFESTLDISNDNLAFFRQWIKLRVYDNTGVYYFKPFIFLLKMLSSYKNIDKNNLLFLIHSISPKMSEKNLSSIINNYQKVSDGQLDFDQFIEKYVKSEKKEDHKINEIIDILSSETIHEEDFYNYFYNGKSKVDIYLKFVQTLLDFRRNSTNENFKKLKKLSKDGKIKRAFGNGSIPFNFTKVKTVEDFYSNNKDNDYIFGSLEKIYKGFQSSKRQSLINEYGDLTQRLTNLSGVIDYSNGHVNLPLQSIFKVLFLNYDIEIMGSCSEYEDYEVDINNPFFSNESTLDSLKISNEDVKLKLEELARSEKLKDLTDLKKVYKDKRISEMNKFIDSKFPKEKVSNILTKFIHRKDEYIKEQVTENTDIPTIFEYIIGIAWYHLSNKKINLLESYNLTLDASFLPLSHASGGQGDIEIRYNDKIVLLESTLMNPNAQKRGELEPVIRHTVNLNTEESLPVQSIFIADTLDKNVMNIFRSIAYTPLYSSKDSSLVTNNVNIFGLTISEIQQLLEINIDDEFLYQKINDSFPKETTAINSNWREKIIESLKI